MTAREQTINDIRRLLEEAEDKLSMLRDEQDNDTLSEAHRDTTRALDHLGRN